MYEREVEGTPVEFGVSGQLHNSDLLMYDRRTETLWEQITGRAVVGELTGDRLEFYPSQMMTWAEWQAEHPDSEVLSRYTGFQRDYEGSPYAAYFGSEELWFRVNALSTQLFAKEFVVGIESPAGSFAAYLERDVFEATVINDTFDDLDLLMVSGSDSGTAAIVFEREVEDQVLTFAFSDGRLVDDQTGTVWDMNGVAVEGELTGNKLKPVRSLRLFWFAWVAFHPETELRRPDQ